MMNDALQVTCRDIEPGTGHLVAELHRGAIPENQWQYTIFASDRIGLLIDALMTDPGHRFIGVYGDGELLGYAQLRQLREGPHLNYIVIGAVHQQAGLGRLLLEHVFDDARRSGSASLSLDVHEENVIARDWYKRLGFAEVSTAVTYLAQPSNPVLLTEEPEVRWSSEQLDRMKKFGVSEFRLGIEDTWFDVGVIGTRLYRVGSRHSQMLIDGLKVLEPDRTTMVVVPSDDALKCDAKRLFRTIRMVCDL